MVKQDGTLIKGMDTIMEEYAQFLRLENISSLGLGKNAFRMKAIVRKFMNFKYFCGSIQCSVHCPNPL